MGNTPSFLRVVLHASLSYPSQSSVGDVTLPCEGQCGSELKATSPFDVSDPPVAHPGSYVPHGGALLDNGSYLCRRSHHARSVQGLLISTIPLSESARAHTDHQWLSACGCPHCTVLGLAPLGAFIVSSYGLVRRGQTRAAALPKSGTRKLEERRCPTL